MNARILAFGVVAALVAPSFLFAREANDPFYEDLWYLDQIEAETAWDTNTGNEEVIVAILDAGVDLDHPDLEGNLWKNKGEIANNGRDDDGNGYVDDVDGWDFVDDDNGPEPHISSNPDEAAVSHGSLVSGMVGAVGNNMKGVVGVNWDVSIMPLRTLDDIGSGISSSAIDAIHYAIDNGARVINLSFSGNTNDPQLGAAIQDAYDAGVVVVAAMGNAGRDTDEGPSFPACYGTDGENWVIGVASTDRNDQKSDFSNFGEDCVDLSAPGEDVFGVSYHDPAEGFHDPYRGFWSGTSMSAPLVSGAAALLLAAYPDLTPEEISNVLKLSVDPLSLDSEFQGKMGAGRLNLAKAFEIGAQFADAEAPAEEEPTAEPELAVLLTTPSTAAVYFIEDSERRAFINDITYFTHFDSFEAVEEVEDEALADFSLGGLVLPKPGVVLVKIQSDPRVYALEGNPSDVFSPLLRHIDAEETAIEMYGEDWADFVIDISPTFFTKFGTGDPITSPEAVDTSIMKTREELAQLVQDN